MGRTISAARVSGEVDKHFLDRFGNAALLTLTGGVAQFVASLGQNQNTLASQQYALDPVTGQLVPVTGAQNSVLLSARADRRAGGVASGHPNGRRGAEK